VVDIRNTREGERKETKMETILGTKLEEDYKKYQRISNETKYLVREANSWVDFRNRMKENYS